MIYPAILTDILEVAQQQISQFASTGRVLHIDIIDGEFADNLTISLDQLSDLDFFLSSIDLHLMTQEPTDFIEEIDPSLPVHTVYAQIERMRDPKAFAKFVAERGWKHGFALDLHTPVESLTDCLHTNPSGILVMNVQAGFQQQEFNQKSLSKLLEIQRLIPQELSPEIVSDGGLQTADQIQVVLESGADSVAIGSALWSQPNPAERLAELENELHSQNTKVEA